jgi:hypothetical protein
MSMILDGSNGVTFNDASLQGAAASPYVLKNRIINGAMVIAQRGTSFSFGTGGGSNYYAVDRFYTQDYQWSAGSNITVSKDTTVYPSEFSASYKWANGATGLTLSAGGYQSITHSIEGSNIADCYNTSVTLSFWVRASTVGTYSIVLTNSFATFDRYIVKTYTINTANTWEQKTITVDMSVGTSSGTWNTTNGSGLAVVFVLGTASNRTGNTALNTWTTPGVYEWATSSSVNLASIANSTFYITGVQLERGTTATPFERRLYNQELANCQRYFEKIQPASDYQMLVSGFVTATTNGAFCLPYSIKRTSPSFTFTAGNTFAINHSTDTATTVTSIAINAGRIGTQSANVHAAVASGLTVGNGCLLMASSPAANCSISISAEL